MVMWTRQNLLCVFLSLAVFVSNPVVGGQIPAPALLKNSKYSESWDQQFLFENNTVISSQFLIVNMPFSKFHGMMVATVKEPQKSTVVIKNGRRRSGWNFSGEDQKLTIFQHELSASTPGFLMQLHNTAAEVDLLFTTPAQAIPLVDAGGKLGLPQITLYAPPARAYARWRAGPEIGGLGPEGEWSTIGHGFGYGLHTVHTKPMNATIKRWRRFTGDRTSDGYWPLFHVIETPGGDRKIIMILTTPLGVSTRFDVTDFTASEGDKNWRIKAHAGENQLTGTITLSHQLERFRLKDQLNGLEKLAAGSLADISRTHYEATYRFSLTKKGVTKLFEGRAMAEDIQMGAVKAKRRRARR